MGRRRVGLPFDQCSRTRDFGCSGRLDHETAFDPRGVLGGFVFALHAVYVESVAWISEQKTTLSAVTVPISRSALS
jgi:hypothetical protein